MYNSVYKNRRVLITGHTGFKGSWLAFWLTQMGANVLGFALEPATTPNHFSLLGLDMESEIGDIRDLDQLTRTVKRFKPDIVFHLAAQPLVRLSYQEPVETFQTNIMGTVHVFEACRQTPSVKAIVNITSDKCYDNKEWVWGYRENDPMGGYDPYSASKGCAELVTAAYRNSFFNPDDYGHKHQVLMASARAGNVIGGGDWAKDRIITDLVETTSQGKTLLIRNPQATRPWQHVLEPLSGYLLLGQKLLEGRTDVASAWNFGPHDEGTVEVIKMVRIMKNYWDKINFEIEKSKHHPHEAGLLKLDCSKVQTKLQWKGVWNIEKTIEKTADWYKEFYENDIIITKQQLGQYIADAANSGLVWTE